MTFLWTETLTPLAFQLRRWHTSGHASGHAHCPVPSAHPDAGQVDYSAKCSLRARFPNLDACECPAKCPLSTADERESLTSSSPRQVLRLTKKVTFESKWVGKLD